MPELPEVQTIVSDLNHKIKGDTITDFWSDAPKTLKDITVEKFKKEIVGKKVLGAHRIGKNMFIDLSGGKTMYLHLKMTGHLLVKNFKFKILNLKSISNNKISNDKNYFNDRVNQYIHHIWYLADPNIRMKSESTNATNKKFNKTLEFSDMRKFAKIVLLDTKDIRNYKDIKTLGIDAMSEEFTWPNFCAILDKRPKVPIGVLLMDQNLIAGIGNIYRSEILFDAGILSTRLAKDISDAERRKLYRSIGKILEKAIKYRGTSDSDYRDTAGAPGNFQKALIVYRKEKQECQKCGTIIQRIKLGGRSVFLCEKCQK